MQNETFKNLYRAEMAKELNRPDIKLEKEAFLREHFTDTSVPVASAGFLIPAFAMAVVFAFFFRMVPPVFEPAPANKAFILPATQPVLKSAAIKKSRAQLEKEKKSGIEIKRLVAKGGPKVKVYSTVSEGRPVAVIWVTKSSAQVS